MKKILFSLGTILLLAIVLFACRKNDNIDNPVVQADLFDNLMQQQKSPVQLFDMNAAAGGQINGKKGTKIFFPPNAFVDINNNPFAGVVTIRLQESFKKTEWMMDGLSTNTLTQPLISAGMINIEATRKDNGAELKLAPAMVLPNANLNAVVKVEVPRNANAAILDMNVFVPDSTQGGIAGNTTTPVLAWKAAPYYTMSNGPNSYIFQLPKFKWTNCDQIPSGGAATTTIRVIPDMTKFAAATNVQAMLVYRNINMVITLPPKTTFFESYTNYIPIGSQADVVLIGKTATGNILFKVLPLVTFTSNMAINITPDEVKGNIVTAYLNSIN